MKSMARLYWNVKWMNISRKWVYELNNYVYRNQSENDDFLLMPTKHLYFFKLIDKLYSIISGVSYWIINGRSIHEKKGLRDK